MHKFYMEGKYQYNAFYELIYVAWDYSDDSLKPRRIELELDPRFQIRRDIRPIPPTE